MIASLCLLSAVLSGPEPARSSPPPLTEEQITKVRTLVQRTQEQQARLKRQLDRAQQSLAKCYADYDLDSEAVKKLHTEILDLQGKLLASYHTMQKELRAIVGPERFKILRRRIDNALESPPKPKKD